jgi:WD40 repeat protein
MIRGIMALSATLQRDILRFLTSLPNIHDPDAQRALIHSAAPDAELPGKITFGGPSEQFFTLLIPALISYGPLADGRDPLEALLEAAKIQVGPDRQAQGERLIAQWRACAQGPDAGANPYRGLSAFREEDERLFFGRDVYAAKLLDAAQHRRFVAVLGASGSGKSSLVYAGLLPKLRRQGGWQIAPFRPLTAPWFELAAALIPLRDPDSDATDHAEQIDKLTAKFAANAVSVATTLKQIARNTADSRILLVIDQFEELYAPENAPVCASFIRGVLDALTDTSIPVTLVITLRSDFLGQTHSTPELSHLIADHSLIVPAMNADELRSAIAEPARQAGQPLSADVVDLLIEQTKEREGALPLLEFALMRIWEGCLRGIEPTDTLKQIGGVGGALAGVAQTLYDDLNERDQQIARRAFLAMIRLGEGTRDTRRNVGLNEIVGHQDDPEQIYAVLRHFAHPNARLITLDADAAEITHESLFEHWDALKNWLDAGRDDLRFHRRLADAAQHWDTSKRPDGLLWRPPDLELLQQYHQRNQQDMTALQVTFFQQSTQKEKQMRFWRRVTRAGLVILTVISVIGAMWAVRSERIAKESEQIAQEERKKAEINEIEALNQTAKNLFASHDELNALLAAIKAGTKIKQMDDVLLATKYQTMFTFEKIISSIRQKNRIEEGFDYDYFGPLGINTVLSPNGNMIASEYREGSKPIIKLYSFHNMSQVKILRGYSEFITSIAFSPDSSMLAIGDIKGTIKIWNIFNGDEITLLQEHSDAIVSIAFNSDGSILASASEKMKGTTLNTDNKERSVKLWNIAESKVIKIFQKTANAIKFSPNNQLIALLRDDSVEIIRLEDGIVINSLEISSERRISSMEFSPDGKLLAFGDRLGMIRLWNITNDEDEFSWIGHSSTVTSILFSKDGKWLVSGSNDSSIKIWDIEAVSTYKVQIIQEFLGDLGIYDIRLSEDKTQVISRSVISNPYKPFQKIEIWHVKTDDTEEMAYSNIADYKKSLEEMYHILKQIAGPRRNTIVDFSIDGRMLAIGSIAYENDFGVAILWDIKDSKLLLELHEPHFNVSYVALRLNKLICVFYDRDGSDAILVVQDIENHEKIRVSLKEIPMPFIVSPDGETFAFESTDHTIKLLSLKDGQELFSLRGHSDVIYSFAFNNKGTILASASRDETIKLWDVRKGQEIRTLDVYAFDLAFNFESKMLASASPIKLWDVLNGKEIGVIQGSRLSSNITFSPDDSVLVSMYGPYEIKLWDIKNRNEITTLLTANPWFVKFTPDGTILFAGSSLFSLDFLDDLLPRGCEWLQDYLHNPYANLSDEDRALCDDILRDAE